MTLENQKKSTTASITTPMIDIQSDEDSPAFTSFSQVPNPASIMKTPNAIHTGYHPLWGT